MGAFLTSASSANGLAAPIRIALIRPMHFPRFWTTVNQGDVSAWGWSDESRAKAEGHAQERLLKILERLRHGGRPTANRYGYPDRPMREEVLREFRDGSGGLAGAVTRNSYGCLVLNAVNLLIVDVDAPAAKESRFLAGLFGFKKPDNNGGRDVFIEDLNSRISGWLAASPEWGWRVYRTAAGMRLVATHKPFAPADIVTAKAFDAFGADPLYRRLCGTQKCFRARLTPKPWRCGMDKPRGRWPWGNEKTEARFRQWETKYLAKAKDYATCQLLGHFGSSVTDRALMPLIEFHDQISQAGSGLPLA